MTIYQRIDDEAGRSEAAVATNGARSWRRMIWVDEGEADAAAKVAVWSAQPGLYAYPARPLAESFVVMEGEADCRIAGGDVRRIGPGDIVNVPVNAPISLEVLKPFRKFAMVVPKA
ncbi:cupin domain-containing protein [Rhizobium sp. SYY.PMSO]|uniref:cupin domain-containing protein n=1 Tax=Rhizobium sp. SYY.PMSO TaxID=3382192 RepID=UPI000DDE3DDA